MLKTYYSIKRTVYVYDGIRGTNTEIPLYLDLCDHSPTGFNWGFLGSGCAQLAFAIIYDFTEDIEFTNKYYFAFKKEVIAKLNHYEDFVITGYNIEKWMEQKRKEETKKNEIRI